MGRKDTANLTAFVAALVMAAAAAAAELPQPRGRWIELDTPNFTFFSDASRRTTRRVAADLEELRAVLAGYATAEPSSGQPTRVYVFRSHAAFQPYNVLYEGRPAASAGYFIAGDDADYIAIDADSRLDASAIVYHEYLHNFAAENLRGLPLWFEEGLGDLYQSFRLAGDRVRFGFPNPTHLRCLNESPLIPLSRLIEVDHGSPLYNEQDRKTLFYAESWALVHYLVVGSDQRRPEARRFVSLVTAGMPQDEAFSRAFTTDLEGLQEELGRYVQRHIFRYVELPAPRLPELVASIRPLERVEALYRLGDLLAHQEGRTGEAVAHLQAALADNPEHAPSLSALGRLAEDQARWDDAAAYYARAAGAAPSDPSVQYRLGAFLLARGADPAEAVRALERSTKLAPGFAPAWAALARAYLAVGSHSEAALAAAENAHRLQPAHDDVTRDLLRLYLRAGRRDEAMALVAAGLGSAPAKQARGRAMIVNADLHRGNELVTRDELEGAQEAAVMAERTVAGAAGEAELRQRIATLHQRILRHRSTRAYNAAVECFNRGDLDSARRIIDDIEPELASAGQGDELRALRGLLDHPEASAAAVHLLSTVSRDQIEALNGLLRRGDLAGASAYLDELRALAGPSQAAWIDAKSEEIRRVLAYNAAIEAYNRAIDQFNAAAYPAAAATLEGLLAAGPPEDIAGDARALLAEARQATAAP